MSSEIKISLLNQCKEWIQGRRNRTMAGLEEIKLSLLEETKSSAGDKHETGRAMLQIERENIGRQLYEIEKVEELLNKVSISRSSDVACLGSLVITSQSNYFISISAGVLTAFGNKYIAITSNSPIGAILMGKSANEEVNYRGETIKILSIF
jgi:hypothetical protein